MKLIRKVLFAVALVFTLAFHAANQAIASDSVVGAGYVYQFTDGKLYFDSAPCRDGFIVVPVPKEFKPRLKSATAVANNAKLPKIEFCWIEADGVLVIVGAKGPLFTLSLRDPRMSKRTRI